MNRRRFAAVVLALALVSAGCSALPGDPTTATPANATSSSTPATGTSTPSTPDTNTTVTPTPDGNATETPTPDNDTTSDESRQSLPRYAAMMDRILRSNDTAMSSLDTPLPDSNTLHSGIVDVKSVRTEPYASGTDNDTRLRIEYYNTNHTGDGLNEIRVVTQVYSHAMNQSLENNDTLAFDEVVVVSYENASSTTPGGRVVIDEFWMLYYTHHTLSHDELFNSIIFTAEGHKNGIFGRYPIEFQERFERDSPENVTLLRLEEFSTVLFVDYSTSTPVTADIQRAREMYSILTTFGEAVNNDEFTGVDGIMVEERHRTDSSEYDIRTWYTYNASDAAAIASGEMPRDEALALLRETITYEASQLGK